MNCEWTRANAALYIYDELADDARYELEQHLKRCADCTAEVEAVSGLKQVMAARPMLEVTPNLLAASRMRLQEALEHERQAGSLLGMGFDLTGWFRQMRLSPALALALVMAGFAVGGMTTYRVHPWGAANPGATQGGAAEASIAGIRAIVPNASNNSVEIKYDTLTPQSRQGSLDDPRIQQLLLFAARNNINSGVRMDSIDLLTKKPEDARIREALMYAVRYDKNPGVRLKSLEGLRPYVAEDKRVRDTVLEALINDSNPGVRSLSLNLLKQSKADGSVRQTLEVLAAHDENKFIRSESRRMLANMPEID